MIIDSAPAARTDASIIAAATFGIEGRSASTDEDQQQDGRADKEHYQGESRRDASAELRSGDLAVRRQLVSESQALPDRHFFEREPDNAESAGSNKDETDQPCGAEHIVP